MFKMKTSAGGFALATIMILFIASPFTSAQVTFTQTPTATLADPFGIKIAFGVSASTDVEVAILNASGKIVRHLAAGVLGGQFAPPEPLTAGLSQEIIWYGKDDYGNAAAGGPFKARVRIGLKPVYERAITGSTVPGLSSGSYKPTGEFPSQSHPIFTKINGHVAGFTGHPHLDIAADYESDEIFVKLENTDEHRINGSTGQYAGKVSFSGLSGRSQWGEIELSWDGQVIFHSTAFDTVHRYNRSGQAAPWSGIASNEIGGLGQGFMHSRGHAASTDGSLYVLHFDEHREYHFGLVTQIGPDGAILRSKFIKTPAPPSGGVRVDMHGNIYVAAFYRPGMTMPPDLQAKLPTDGTAGTVTWWASQMYGTLIKYDPAGKVKWAFFGMSHLTTHDTYPHGGAGCVCNVSRFDVDRFGRIFLPDAFQFQAIVLDNNRNEIMRFKHNDQTIGWGGRIVVTRRALYIADQVNDKIAVFRLDTEKEETVNLPTGIENGAILALGKSMNLTNFPNPFTPYTAVRYRISGNGSVLVALSVHDVKGTLVKTLFKGQKEPGYYTVNWDGKDELGKEAASGIYLCRLTQGTAVKQIKMFLVQ